MEMLHREVFTTINNRINMVLQLKLQSQPASLLAEVLEQNSGDHIILKLKFKKTFSELTNFYFNS